MYSPTRMYGRLSLRYVNAGLAGTSVRATASNRRAGHAEAVNRNPVRRVLFMQLAALMEAQR
jgi:hypothetical protein